MRLTFCYVYTVYMSNHFWEISLKLIQNFHSWNRQTMNRWTTQPSISVFILCTSYIELTQWLWSITAAYGQYYRWELIFSCYAIWNNLNSHSRIEAITADHNTYSASHLIYCPLLSTPQCPFIEPFELNWSKHCLSPAIPPETSMQL